MQIRSNLTTGMMSFSFSWTVVSYLKIEHESVTKEKEKTTTTTQPMNKCIDLWKWGNLT